MQKYGCQLQAVSGYVEADAHCNCRGQESNSLDARGIHAACKTAALEAQGPRSRGALRRRRRHSLGHCAAPHPGLLLCFAPAFKF